jgi:hypothetical protein
MKKILFFVLIFSFIIFTFPSLIKADTLFHFLAGRILLQVEENGEAWYVNPQNWKRSFLGRPDDAFSVMRQQGIGISNENLAKIPVSLDYLSGKDSNGDGLPDAFKEALGLDVYSADSDGDGYDDLTELLQGHNPLGASPIAYDFNFSKAQAGKIFIQVENNGEAWYVNPVDIKRYFLGRPLDAFNIMRNLGLGITNKDLEILEVEQVNNAYNLLGADIINYGEIQTMEQLVNLPYQHCVVDYELSYPSSYSPAIFIISFKTNQSSARQITFNFKDQNNGPNNVFFNSPYNNFHSNGGATFSNNLTQTSYSIWLDNQKLELIWENIQLNEKNKYIGEGQLLIKDEIGQTLGDLYYYLPAQTIYFKCQIDNFNQ